MRKTSKRHFHTLLIFNVIYLFSLNSVAGHEHFPEDSSFKDYYFTPTGVYGRIPLGKTANRSFVTISRKKDEVVVLLHNASGILLTTTHIQFSKGKLSVVAMFDRWGEPVDSMWFTPTGPNEFFVTERQKGQNPNYPCMGLRLIYKNDLLTDMYCMADSNKTWFNQEGVAHYVFERYDDPRRFNLIKSQSFFGKIDDPAMSRKAGCHKIMTIFDENGDMVSKSLFGLKDEPVNDQFGSCKTTMKYDKNSNQTEIAYVDANGVTWNDYLGCARRGFEYNKGLLEKETFYDDKYNIVRSKRGGDSSAIVKYRYDPNGNQIEKAFFDEKEASCNNAMGISRAVSVFNNAGMLTDISFFEKKGFSVTDEHGVHHYRYTHGATGQITSKSEFSAGDLPMKDLTDMAYTTKLQYDAWGRIRQFSFWLNDAVKMTNAMGYHGVNCRYDSAGMLAQAECIDTNDRVSASIMGYSVEKDQYNEQGLLKLRSYFNGDEPAMISDTILPVSKIHTITYAYNFSNLEKEIEYFDNTGKPINSRLNLFNGRVLSCHKIELTYSGALLASEQFYDAENNPVGRADCLKENCVLLTGLGLQVKKVTTAPSEKIVRTSIHGVTLTDSIFYASQMALLGGDSILIFLNAQANYLSEQECARYYRIAHVNKYFQFDGPSTDYEADNDSLCDRFTYSAGALNGPCTWYYRNGSTRQEGEYANNHRVGYWNYFYDNGQKAKTINFASYGTFLVDSYTTTGEPLVEHGNGTFTGIVDLGRLDNFVEYTVSGKVKDGVPDGDWKLFRGRTPTPFVIEKFSAGKFIKGTQYGSNGEVTYRGANMISFEGVHPQEKIDHYGQNYYCTLLDNKAAAPQNFNSILYHDFYPEIREGIGTILKTNRFRDYSGWILLFMHFDNQGLLRRKDVRMYQANEAFRTELFKLMDRLAVQAPLQGNNLKNGLDKFYIALVEDNQVVLPEELLNQGRQGILH
ncbi:MAG TPA: hypothetical protein VKR32_00830 [Puia sp.]|nr:hypothetical protein [Puia sp.]